MSIDLSRVNISLKQFQKIASGKYNAGEVTLAGETKLGRPNHHIHFEGFNDTAHSHEEVLAVKNAFVNALSSNGVDAAVDRLPAAFRLDLDPGTTFSATLN